MTVEIITNNTIETVEIITFGGGSGGGGADGKSAYQIAVDSGFVGTETDWLLSLNGANGTDGLNGADGAQGIQGIPGADGSSSIDDTAPSSSKVYSSQKTQDSLDLKVDKITGKGLSAEDYSTTEKTKLSGIAAGAEVNVNADWNASNGEAQILNKPTIPTKASDLTNDVPFLVPGDISGKANNSNTVTVNGSTQSLSSNPNFTVAGGSGGAVKQIYTGTTSVVINNTTTWLILNPPALAASESVQLPAAPSDGQKIEVVFGGTITSGSVITSLTITPGSGQTILGTTTFSNIAIGDKLSFQYNSTNLNWYQ